MPQSFLKHTLSLYITFLNDYSLMPSML